MANLLRVSARCNLNLSSDSPLHPPAKGSASPTIKSVGRLRQQRAPSGFPSPLSKSRYRNVGLRSTEKNNSLSHAFMKTELDQNPTADELCSFSFSPAFSKGSFVPLGRKDDLFPRGEWSFNNYVGRSPSQKIHPSAILNPNKAVMTIDCTGKILTANDMTFLLLGPEEEIAEKANLLDFITESSSQKAIELNFPAFQNANLSDCPLPLTVEEDLVASEGLVVFCGKVISINASDIGKIPVSLWMKKLPTEEGEDPRWIVVMEPIKVTKAMVTVDMDGIILKHDEDFRKMFGYDDDILPLNELNIFDHVTSLKLPIGKPSCSMLEEQQCAGHSFDGATFPVSVTAKISAELSDLPTFKLKFKMFSHISGLVIVDENSTILDYNHSFMRLLFGYGANELKGSHISKLLPDFDQMNGETTLSSDAYKMKNDPKLIVPFLDEMTKENSVGWTSVDNADKTNANLLSDNKANFINSDGSLYSLNKGFIMSESQFALSSNNLTMSKSGLALRTSATNSTLSNTISNPGSDVLLEETGSPGNQNITPIMKDITNATNLLTITEQFPVPFDSSCDVSQMPLNCDVLTSTPAGRKRCSKPPTQAIQEGSYIGTARHNDGTELTTIYQISKVSVGGKDQFCFWIMWEPDDVYEESTKNSDLSLSQIEEPERLKPHKDVGPTKNMSSQSSRSEIRLTKSLSSQSSQSEIRLTKESNSSYSDYLQTQDHRSDSMQSIDSLTQSDSKQSLDSLTHSYDFESPIRKPSGKEGYCQRKSSRFGRSLTKESSCDDTDSITATEGSSEDEFSLAEDTDRTKRRSMSEGVIIRRPKKRSVKDEKSVCEEADDVLMCGDYQDHYSILRQIGKGAFGYVKLSYKNYDGLIVVTKFIKKDQVYRDSWNTAEATGKRIPLEIFFLMQLDHPNIVRAYDYFENDDYFQLVMEKWGAGMDLFEFIEHNPALDEPLASYIFRQIVSALIYLKSKNILHRDIKDENIIINHKFHVKLIDFGSATFWDPTRTYSQFAGTVEYCSPEVLKGAKYRGHEVEVWSLGITLYTLIYGENPFFSTSEILKKDLYLPITYSTDLCSLLHGMIEKNPDRRMTLEATGKHPWTNLPIDLECYRFEDIVGCCTSLVQSHRISLSILSSPVPRRRAFNTTWRNDKLVPHEIDPCRYISEYSESEGTLSTTSSSFVYENRTSVSASEMKDDSTQSWDAEGNWDEGKAHIRISIPNNHGTNASRTSTRESTSSLRSTVSIDSNLFSMSPTRRAKTRSADPSESSNDCSSGGSGSCLSGSTTSLSSINKAFEFVFERFDPVVGRSLIESPSLSSDSDKEVNGRFSRLVLYDED